MPATLTTVNDVLKEVYHAQAFSDVWLKNSRTRQFFRNQARLSGDGKYGVIPIGLGRPESYGNTGETGTLPGHGHQHADETINANDYDRITVETLYYHGSIRISKATMLKARQGVGSFVDEFSRQLKHVFESAEDHHNKICYVGKTGDLAALASANAASGSAGVYTLTLDTTAGSGSNVFGLGLGTPIDIVSAADSRITNGSGYVSAIFSASTFEFTTWSGNITVGDADSKFVKRVGAMTNGEHYGFADMIASTGTFPSAAGEEGINRANFWQWKSQTIAAGDGDTDPIGGTEFTVERWDHMCMKLHEEGGYDFNTTGVIFTSPAIRRAYASEARTRRDFVGYGPVEDLGLTAMQYEGRPIIVDRQCQYGNSWFVNPETLWQLDLTNGLEWLDDDGGILKINDGTPEYYAVLCYYMNCACNDPRENGVISGQTVGAAGQ